MENFSLLQTDHSDSSATEKLGARGELLAYEFLLKQGFRPVCANFKAPVGRNRRDVTVTGEIDLVCYEAEKLCFIEVKTRTSADFASPLAAVDKRKQRQIIRTGRKYRKIFRLENAEVRYDVVSVLMRNENSPPEIELFRGYFSEADFARKSWLED